MKALECWRSAFHLPNFTPGYAIYSSTLCELCVQGEKHPLPSVKLLFGTWAGIVAVFRQLTGNGQLRSFPTVPFDCTILGSFFVNPPHGVLGRNVTNGNLWSPPPPLGHYSVCFIIAEIAIFKHFIFEGCILLRLSIQSVWITSISTVNFSNVFLLLLFHTHYMFRHVNNLQVQYIVEKIAKTKTDVKRTSMVCVRERTTPHRATDACRRSNCQLLRIEGATRSQRDGSLRPYSRISRQEPLLFYQVAHQLY
jgi:hypothetical protein